MTIAALANVHNFSLVVQLAKTLAPKDDYTGVGSSVIESQSFLKIVGG